MSRNSLLFLLIFFLSYNTIVSCNSHKNDSSKQSPPPPVIVDVIITGEKQLNNVIELNGSVIAGEKVEIHPEVNGRLTLLNMPDGATVQQGTVLARINDADLQAQLSKCRSQLQLAEKNEDRLKKLLQINAINQSEYDIALNTLNNTKADLELINAQLEKTVIKAPFSGKLGLRLVSPGAYVTTQTIMSTLQQDNQVKVDFVVPETHANLVKTGLEIELIGDDQQKYSAVIIATESSINTSTGNLKVRAGLKNSNLKPGSFVKVLLSVGRNDSSIVVPTNAIIPEANTKKVIVVRNGLGEFVKVKTGIRSAGGVEITEGLTAGDTVVVNGVLFVKPGKPLKVRSVLKTEDQDKK